MSSKPRRREVDWGNYVRRDAEQADQVLWTLMGINVLVFVLWHVAAGSSWVGSSLMNQHFTVSAEGVLSGRIWTLLTSEFSHVGFGHLFFNMLGLYVFGRDVGHRVGARGLLVLYLGGALAASIGHVVFQLVTFDPSPALGASGAVMALAVAFGAMFPTRQLLLYFVPVQAQIAVLLYIALDLFGITQGNTGVAHAAHLAGAAFGFAYWWFRERRPRRR